MSQALGSSCHAVNAPAYPSVLPSRDSSNVIIILPKLIYIKDSEDRFLTQRAGPTYATLTFRAGEPDIQCIFQANRTTGSWYRLNAHGNHPVMRYYSGWYSSDYPSSKPSYNVILAREHQVYLKDNYGPSRFVSNELRDSGAPIGQEYIKESCLLEVAQASTEDEITNIQYDIPGAKASVTSPVIALVAELRNDSDVTLEETLIYTYDKSVVGTWNNVSGIEIGKHVAFEAGVPFVSNAELDVSVSTSSPHEWGGEDVVTKAVTSSAIVSIPPRKKLRATIVVLRAQLDVGFTYNERIVWADGHSEEEKKDGIYTNIDSWHVDVVIDANWEDLPSIW